MIAASDITGVVLAGGQGSRMGGVDKGLQLFQGMALAQRAAQRLAPQVGPLALSANRHLDRYAAFGWPVWADTLPGHPGPLAGLLAALARCETAYLASVPCDGPMFPLDLVTRLSLALQQHGATAAVASAPDAAGALRRQPVFCLVHRSARADLADFLDRGERKIGAWLALQRSVTVPFDRPGDARDAFANANTFEDLRALEQASTRMG